MKPRSLRELMDKKQLEAPETITQEVKQDIPIAHEETY